MSIPEPKLRHGSEWLSRGAAWVSQGVLLVLVWAGLSYLTTAHAMEERTSLPPFGPLGYALGAVALLALILPRLCRTRKAGGIDPFRLVGLGMAATAVVAVVFDREAAAPAAGALWLAVGWIAADGPKETLRLFRRAPLLRMLVAGMVVVELLLQLTSAVVAHATRSAAAHRDADVRILCVGDSFTFGIGATTAECTWPGALELRLRNALPDRSVEVWNCGVPAQNSCTMVKRLPQQLDGFQPQIVIVCIGTNNQWDMSNVDLARYKTSNRGLLWRRAVLQQVQKLRLARLVQLSGFRFYRGEPAPIKGLTTAEFGWYWGRASAVADATALREQLRQSPENSYLWHELTRRLEEDAQDEAALAAADEGIRHATETRWLWREKGMCLSRLNRPEEAMEAFEQNILCGSDGTHFWDFALTAYHFDSDKVLRHAEELKVKQPELYALIPQLEKGHFDERAYYRLVWADLEETLRLCRNHKAALVLHTYPFWAPDIAYYYDLFARSNHCPLVEQWPYLQAAQQREPGVRLYVADGHCNDRGYALMAENLLPTVLRILKEKGLANADAGSRPRLE